MSNGSLEEVLDAARRLPMDQQRDLAERLIKDVGRATATPKAVQDALDAVEKTRGAMKGLDRDTVIWLAEDEELGGY
jgi:hypothetical protein